MKIIKTIQELFPLVQPHLPKNPIIVEAGAFTGHDTIRMSNFWPQGTVHAFEPVPQLFQQLQQATEHLNNVICHDYALSSITGTAQFYVAEKPHKPGIPTQAGSLRRPKERLALSPIIFPSTISVSTIMLDDWAHQYAISHIDFLWLDIQGCELDVLKASPHILGTVKAIYTEVEFIEAYEGQPLYNNVTSWLEHQGFTLAAQDFLDPTPHHHFFGNVLFVRL